MTLSSTQFGAIENRSAIDALFAITHPASEALLIPTISNSGKLRPDRPTLLANDIRGAFNNTDPAPACPHNGGTVDASLSFPMGGLLCCYTLHTVQPRAITRRSNSEQ